MQPAGADSWATAYIGLGANLGDARDSVIAAIEAIGKLAGTRVLKRSSLYSSAPVDAQGPDFVNAVVEISTQLDASTLLARLQEIENAAGRERPFRNAPRTLDLDILEFADQRTDSASLTLPHPRMHQRAFVLVPLAEIAPHRVTQAQLDAVAGQRLHRL